MKSIYHEDMDTRQHPFVKPAKQDRSQKAVENIVQAAKELLDADPAHTPTTRNLVKKSGYSMGTIFRYFEKIDDLFVYLFLQKHKKEVSRVIARLKEFPPENDIDSFIQLFIDTSLNNWTKNGASIQRNKLVIRLYLKRTKEPELINTLLDEFIPVFLEIQEKNSTGTLRVMTQEECQLALRAATAIMRSPFIENHPIAGTEIHYLHAKNLLRKLFGTD